VSPRSLDDAWITNGMDRYSELMAVENQSGASAFKAAIDKTAAGALAHDTIPLSSAGRLNPLSPEFQAMTFDKGAMVFHMLRWEVGDKAFLATLKAALRQYSGGSVGTADFEKLAESVSGQSLTAFFAQWVDRTGAPQFTNDYAVYRLGNNQGFRVTGVIGQNPDAFRLPVELSVETEGRTETERIEVMSARTPYQLDTFGRPRRIAIDPDDWVLKSSPQTGATGP
jgi:aminopeptidase N